MMNDRLEGFEPLSMVLARAFDLIEREMVRNNPAASQWPAEYLEKRREANRIRESVK